MEDLNRLQVPVAAHAMRAVVLLDDDMLQLSNVDEAKLEDVLRAALKIVCGSVQLEG